MLKIKKIKPTFASLVTTMDKYDKDEIVNGIINTSRQKGSIKEYQTVIAVGPLVRDINVGDIVFINPKDYRQLKH